MAKKSKHKKKFELAGEGTARRTLRAANFFSDRARDVEPSDIAAYGYYVEAAIVFAWMVLEHLEKEKPSAEKWVRNLVESSPSIRDLKKQRNLISHQRSITTTRSARDLLYYGEPSGDMKFAHETLRDQLNQIETIVDQCEKLFK